MKYFLSLLKYIGIIILILIIFLGIQLLLPQKSITLTPNQAKGVIISGIIIMAIGLKVTFDN